MYDLSDTNTSGPLSPGKPCWWGELERRTFFLWFCAVGVLGMVTLQGLLLAPAQALPLYFATIKSVTGVVLLGYASALLYGAWDRHVRSRP